MPCHYPIKPCTRPVGKRVCRLYHMAKDQSAEGGTDAGPNWTEEGWNIAVEQTLNWVEVFSCAFTGLRGALSKLTEGKRLRGELK